MAWWAVAKLSLMRKSRICVGLRGDWQLVTLTRLFLSSKKKEKDVNEPLVFIISLIFLFEKLHAFVSFNAAALHEFVSWLSGLATWRIMPIKVLVYQNEAVFD